MSAQVKEFTYQDVAEHNTKTDLYLVISDKIYSVAKFIDEHPGGEEVLLDVAGQDATEAFEDVGHSDEARETLEQLLIGKLKRQAGDPSPSVSAGSVTTATQSTGAGFGIGVYALLVIGGAAAYFAYQYLQQQQQQPSA
ncbi:putative cytochrome b5 [Niveomyces insectorum RCEF 264]|uniref:Putative cytochrome b5 n=1 Tax=Niveomyces insectorum RCEF 264 TaxID=1081102 RepID=A0A167XNZ2_9HYPO|nr:putative cytochrome b5 [Niveomyces insectorum RCEF 264]